MLLGYFYTALLLFVEVAKLSQLSESGINLPRRHAQGC